MRTSVLRGAGAIAAAVSLLGVEATALAQSSAVDPSSTPPLALDRFHPAPPGDRMFGVESPDVSDPGALRFSVVGDYAHDPLVLQTAQTAQDRGRVLRDQLFLHLQAGFALFGRLYLNGSFPVAVLQDGGSPVVDGTIYRSPSGAAVGDLRLGARVRLFGGEEDPFQVALAGHVWIPTGGGTTGTYVSDGSVRGLPKVVLGGRAGGRFFWTLNGGVDLRSSKVFGGPNGVSQGAMARFDGGVGLLLLSSRALQVGLEGSAAFLLDNATNVPIERATNLEVLLGGKYRLFDFEIGAAAGPGLTSGLGTPDVRAVGSIAFVPSSKRPVGPLDLDKDGITDAEDACPSDAGAARAGAKINGCPDSDSDGLVDPDDACPKAAGPTRADPKQSGCPDPDADKDGIADARDACPNEQGPASEDPRKNGCPVKDADKDGIDDPDDACPEDAGVASADPKQNGCPADTDGDGILDRDDACPAEKGAPDADPRQSGCPKAVRVTVSEIVILQEVQFDTARSSIKLVSGPLLDEVAGVLREHPEIQLVEVQGHTDDRGAADYNRKLSQARAESVRSALIQRKIDGARLQAIGHGPDRPVADNKTVKGREKNRRVQFVILNRDK